MTEYTTEEEWLAACPTKVWRDSQTNENEVSAPMQTVADMVGVTRSAVMQWEQGKFMPKFQSLLKLTELLGYASGTDLYTEWQAWLDAKPVTDGQPVAV